MGPTKTMKTRHFYLLCGLIAAFGVTTFAQVLNPLPARVLGQTALPKTTAELLAPPATSPNLLEGREFLSPQAVAVDGSSDPAIVYVVDTGNHRVLGWKAPNTQTNGARADFVLGQKNLSSGQVYGGAALASFSSGLYNPSALAVDRNGNVFVMDSGNNRVVRYPKPGTRVDETEPQLADLVIGQPNLTSSAANRGAAGAAEWSVHTNSASTGGPQMAGITFDGAGNLWLADAGNHRVMRYPAAAVSGPSNVGPNGSTVYPDLVLGQFDFNATTPNPGRLAVPADRINKLQMRFPNALAFDAGGRLFVLDDLGRVLVYQPPFDSYGKPASRILGIYAPVAGQQPPPPVNDLTFTVMGTSQGTYAGGPSALFTVGDFLFVADTASNRVVRYDPFYLWTPEMPGSFSPRMSAVYGQDSFYTAEPNNGVGREPSAKYLDGPLSGAFFNGELFLVDSRNHRVLIHPYDLPSAIISPATRILGQIDFPFRTGNLIEGREFALGSLTGSSGQKLSLGIGMAMEVTPEGTQRFYVADTGNNRILGYSDARKWRNGDRADLVIGQVDFNRSLMNSPGASPQTTDEGGLALPSAVAVDAEGNLWVADTGNGRVVRFPKPFDNPSGPIRADLVIGQPDFNARANGIVARDRLFRPSAVAVTFDGHLVVSDLGHSRVLLFRQPFSNGQAADIVLGQPDGETAGAGNSDAGFSLPMGLAIDTDDRLYVADTLNGRISIFDRISAQTDGANAALVLPIPGGQPHGVTVSARTGEIFVPELRTGRVFKYPRFDQLIVSGNFDPDPGFVLPAFGPRSVLLDPLGNIYVADSANRITVHHPQLLVWNGVNGFPKVAPAMMGVLRAPGVTLATDSGSASGPVIPTQLGGLEVLVNDVPAPLTQVDSDNIRFIVPKSAPGSGFADFVVRRVATSEIVAYSRVAMTNVSPAVIYQGTNPAPTGQAQARAFNQDGSANTATAGASFNQELTVLLTGHGAFDALPDDGMAPGSAVPVPDAPRAFIRVGTGVTECTVLSSTLDPDQPGVWRIKVKVPQVTTNGLYGFLVLYRSVASDSMTNPALSVRPQVQVNR